jgi:hypothetical protein
MIDAGRVLEALSTVRDPELDEPITELGFVERVEISGGTVSVKLVLPTFFSAPNSLHHGSRCQGRPASTG